MLVLFGAGMNIWSLSVLQHVYLGVDFWYVTSSRLLQGFGLGFLFVPLTTIAFAGLKPQQMGQATGLFNLLRNEGGSIGIALSSTILARHSQAHHLHLVENLTPGNLVLQERLAAMTQGLGQAAGVDPTTAHQLAWRALEGQVMVQAHVMAYNDVFRMLTMAFVGFLPFILLLGGKIKSEGAAPH